MKILHVVHQFLPYHHHGAEVSTYELARMQQSKGHEVVVVAGENGHYSDEIHIERDSYREIEVLRFYFNPRSTDGWLKHEGFADGWRSMLEHERPDIVHIQQLLNLSLSLIDVTHEMNIPIVFTLRDFSPLCQRITLVRGNGDICRETDLEHDCRACLAQTNAINPIERVQATVDLFRQNVRNSRSWRILGEMVLARIRSQKVQPPLRLATSDDLKLRTDSVLYRLRKIDRITAISEDTATRFEHLASGRVQVQPLQQVPDTTRCVWRQRKSDVEPVRFGYVGKIRFEKGVQVLLKAFRHLPLEQAKLLLFGGPTRTDVRQLAFWRRLKRLAEWPGVQIFSDPFDPADISEVMNQIDVLIVPSIWFEAYGRVVAEALASGIPVICSDEGGPASVIQPDNNGLTFKLGDEMDLVAKMRRFLDEPKLLEQMSAEAHPPKTPDQYLDEVLAMYDDVIQQNQL